MDNTDGAVCGDGQVEGDEQCDDENVEDGDGCLPGCRTEEGWICQDSPSICETQCGDSIIAGDEQCDDDNTEDGDGCSSECMLETIVSPVVINEIAAAPSEGEDWIELYNTADDAMDLSGWWVTDEEGAMEHRFDLPANTSIPANGHLVFERDVTEGFTFGLGGADSVFLYNASDELIDSVTWERDQSPEGGSYGRSPQGTGDFMTFETSTKGEDNP